MAVDLKTLTPTSLPTTGFLFGADSQASTNPSVYGVTTAITAILGNAASSDVLAFNSDTILARDDANKLAQRNGIFAQTFSLYGTYTDVSNYERLSLQYSAASDYTISVDEAGSGSYRSLTILTYGNATTTFESETIKIPNNGRLAWTSSGTSRGSADTILSRAAAGIVQFGTTSSNASGTLKAAVVGTTTAYIVATLPAGFAGARAYVTDAFAPTFLGTLTGGGAVVCPVFHNGTAWVPA
jgi:hypothetical protein